jgi:hypothetical protein
MVKPGGPADGKLRTGDVITSVDGETVTRHEEVVSKVRQHRPGDMLQIGFRRNGADQMTILTAADAGNGQALIGVELQTDNLKYKFPFEVRIDTGLIGGPSAGLAFTLALIDDLAGGELTGGRDVAVTGTIDDNGNVGEVGGMAQKAITAKRAGAVAFLVPPAEEKEAREFAGEMRIIAVRSLNDALNALHQLGGTEVAQPATPPTSTSAALLTDRVHRFDPRPALRKRRLVPPAEQPRRPDKDEDEGGGVPFPEAEPQGTDGDGQDQPPDRDHPREAGATVAVRAELAVLLRGAAGWRIHLRCHVLRVRGHPGGSLPLVEQFAQFVKRDEGHGGRRSTARRLAGSSGAATQASSTPGIRPTPSACGNRTGRRGRLSRSPVGQDPPLRLGQRHPVGAHPDVQGVLLPVLVFRLRPRPRPEVALVVGGAADAQGDEVVLLVVGGVPVGVGEVGQLAALEGVGVGRRRADGPGVAGGAKLPQRRGRIGQGTGDGSGGTGVGARTRGGGGGRRSGRTGDGGRGRARGHGLPAPTPAAREDGEDRHHHDDRGPQRSLCSRSHHDLEDKETPST